ncbi:hypothetical protein OA418_04415 [Candidatus Pelagibacter sp.]|nr:hypothetical protein [Candidatus Pelagibacter sp.]MDC3126059.1 hypothetical protein [Candidatus Pelagibacter sp.]
MKKNFILLFLLICSCGYQPLYKANNNSNNFKIQEIKFVGDNEVGRKIYASIPFVIVKNDKNLNKINIYSNKNTIEASKNSKGQVTSYRTTLTIRFIIKNNNNEQIDEKILKKEFSYSADENKFKFKEYQNEILENLIDGVVEDIIFYLNYS